MGVRSTIRSDRPSYDERGIQKMVPPVTSSDDAGLPVDGEHSPTRDTEVAPTNRRQTGRDLGRLKHFTSASSTDPYTDWNYETLDALQEEVRKNIWYEMQKYQSEIQVQLYLSKNIDMSPIKAIQSRLMNYLLGYQQLTTILNKIIPPEFRE